MIVSPQEYNNLLSRVIDPNAYTAMLRIPEGEPIYNIDLSTRLISAPEFLSVAEDHDSEVIWFKVDRFFDDIDLYDSTCWIQYINAEGETYVYAAPLLPGAQTLGNEMLLIPWCISKEVAKATGIVEFSFQFFKLSEDHNYFFYILNTQPAKSKILYGLRVDPLAFLSDTEKSEQDALPEREWLADELHRLTEAYETLSKAYEMYWIEV